MFPKFLISGDLYLTGTWLLIFLRFSFSQTQSFGFLSTQVFMDGSHSWILFVEWVPAWSLYRGLYEMSEYTFRAVYTNQKRGMTFDKLGDDNNGGFPCAGCA